MTVGEALTRPVAVDSAWQREWISEHLAWLRGEQGVRPDPALLERLRAIAAEWPA